MTKAQSEQATDYFDTMNPYGARFWVDGEAMTNGADFANALSGLSTDQAAFLMSNLATWKMQMEVNLQGLQYRPESGKAKIPFMKIILTGDGDFDSRATKVSWH